MAEQILIIDDDTMNLKMAEHILKGVYDVICVQSGIEGLEILRVRTIDLVLLDLDMPVMSGLEVLEAIRNDKNMAKTKVVILTASGFKSDVTEAIRLGALDFIKKPFFSTELLQRIKKALQVVKKDQILVVDDDRMSLMTAKRILGIRYDVVCVSSGPEALEYVRDEVPNLILLDLHMPQMSGLAVMKKLQEMPEVCDVPVIFITADSDRETEAELLKAGAMDYIQKPFLAEVVIRRISRILELYHFQKSLQREVEKKTEELIESNRRVKNLTTEVILALAQAIDAKDKYTKGHSIRVANYSRELARRMGKKEEELDDIYYIALLHDIGKIGIPDRIINKSGHLTKEEYDLVKEHAVIGANILESITEIKEISSGARWHHERYDGKGYPDGLEGKNIPEVARIIGVAEAYDTMSSKRIYRDVLPQEIIHKEISKGRGTQFDPEVAGHMLAMIEEDIGYHMRGE
ncbi:MAG: response regulator [Lachnospiraceae bacterium]